MKKCVNYDIRLREDGFHTKGRHSSREGKGNQERGINVGGYNLKKKGNRFVARALCVWTCVCGCECVLSPSLCLCMCVCVSVWRVLITSQKVKLGQNASASVRSE